VAILMSKKNRPADPLPTVSYTPPAPPAEKPAETASDESSSSDDSSES